MLNYNGSFYSSDIQEKEENIMKCLEELNFEIETHNSRQGEFERTVRDLESWICKFPGLSKVYRLPQVPLKWEVKAVSFHPDDNFWRMDNVILSLRVLEKSYTDSLTAMGLYEKLQTSLMELAEKYLFPKMEKIAERLEANGQWEDVKKQANICGEPRNIWPWIPEEDEYKVSKYLTNEEVLFLRQAYKIYLIGRSLLKNSLELQLSHVKNVEFRILDENFLELEKAKQKLKMVLN